MPTDTLPAPTDDPAETGSPSWEHRKAVQGGNVFDTLPAVDDWSF